MPKYSVELLGSGDRHEFKSVPSLLKFINSHRGSKGKRNVGPKGLKKILSGNGVFENMLRVKKILKGDTSQTSSNADAEVSKSPTSKAPVDGGEKPEKALPFKTRRARKRKSDDALEGPIAKPMENLKTETTVKAAEEKGNAGSVSDGKVITVDTETPQVKKTQRSSRVKLMGLARGRLSQKMGAIYKSITSSTPVSAPSLFQAFESLKKSMNKLGTAGVTLAAITAAKKNDVADLKTFLSKLDERMKIVETELGQRTGLNFDFGSRASLDESEFQRQAREEAQAEDVPNEFITTPQKLSQIPEEDEEEEKTERLFDTPSPTPTVQFPTPTSQSLDSMVEGDELNVEQDQEMEEQADADTAEGVTPAQKYVVRTIMDQIGNEEDNQDLKNALTNYASNDAFVDKVASNIANPEDGTIRMFKEAPNWGAFTQLFDAPAFYRKFEQKLKERTNVLDVFPAVEESTIRGAGDVIQGGQEQVDQAFQTMQEELNRREEEKAEESMVPEIPLNPEEPNLEEIYPLSATNLENLGRNSVSNYHDLRKMLNTVKDVSTFLKTLRDFGIMSFNKIHISNALEAQLLEVAQSFRTQPSMYAKYIVHFVFFILKYKVRLNMSELHKVEMGLATKFQQFFGVRGEVEDNSITSHIRLMVNEAAGATVDMEPMVQKELVQGAGALDSIEAGLKDVVRTTDNMLMEQEVIARRRMHKSKRRGMILYEPGKSNLATQARLAPFKTPIDPELRRPLTEHMAPSQRVTSVPRISYVQPNRPQRVTIPQKVPTLVGDERPEAFSRDGAKKDLDRSDILNNTRNILNANLSQGAMYGRGAAVDQANLKRRTGITLYSDDKHERRAHKRLRASFTLNMWNET